MYIVNTILGFLIAQMAGVVRRNKNSKDSPNKFNIIYLLKDTWQKIIFSLVLSLLMSLALKYNWDDFMVLFDKDWTLNNVVYLVIGAAPELILQKLRKRYGFLGSKNQ